MDSTWSSGISLPPAYEYFVSQYTHRSEQPVRRTNTHGLPACVDSPWIEKKISVMRIGPLSFNNCSRSAVPHPGCKRDEHAGHDRTQESRRIRTLDTVPQFGKNAKSG